MTLLVGCAPHKRDAAPLRLAANLARPMNEDLRIVGVLPVADPSALSTQAAAECAAWAAQQRGQAILRGQQGAAQHCPDLVAESVALAAHSVPAALLKEAAAHSASLIVVGSGAGGPWGRVLLNATVDRLLHSSPIPVAVAVRGYRNGSTSPVSRVTCALRGDEQSRALIDRAAVLSTLLRVPLRLVTFGVRGHNMHSSEAVGEDLARHDFMVRAASRHKAAVEILTQSGVPVTEAAAVVGNDWADAVDRAGWSQGDLLVVGSSTAGQSAQVFLGPSATRLVRHSPVSVVVVP